MIPHCSQQQRQSFLLALLVAAGLFRVGFPALADGGEANLSLRIDGPTVERGYTASVPNGNFRVAIWPHLLNQPVTVALRPYDGPSLPEPAGLTRVSDVWLFDILKADLTVPDPIVFSRPLTLVLRYEERNLYRKRVFFFDRNQSAWRPLPSFASDAPATIRAFFHLPYAPIAVFEDTNAVEGAASYVGFWRADQAASNDFPYGSRLRVTDLETNLSTTVTVRSTGPFVPGRIIDLSRTAFQALRPLWQGVMPRVRVELLSS